MNLPIPQIKQGNSTSSKNIYLLPSKLNTRCRHGMHKLVKLSSFVDSLHKSKSKHGKYIDALILRLCVQNEIS